jgi:hypothetical protein
MELNKCYLRSWFFLFLWMMTLQFSAMNAYAIAYCAIREPVSIIQEFFPAYISYRTLEGTVDEGVREEVLKALPQSHFQELGTHSLYVVYGEEGISGFVHARTEKGTFGLDEIIWIMNPDMTLKTFKYQKNRSGRIPKHELENLDIMLSGAGLNELVAAREGDGLNRRDQMIVTSGVKALLVTKALWPEL